MKNILSWAIARLKEPSTHAVLTSLLVGVGIITVQDAESLQAALGQLVESGEGIGIAVATLVTTVSAIMLKEKSDA